MWVVFLIHPKIMNANQSGNLKVRANLKCLEEVKIYGNSPKKLFNKIKVNRLVKKIVLPLNTGVLIKTLNSLCKSWFIRIHIIEIREGISQYIGGIIKIINKDLIQFKEKIIVDGSKVENKFIIFSLK